MKNSDKSAKQLREKLDYLINQWPSDMTNSLRKAIKKLPPESRKKLIH